MGSRQYHNSATHNTHFISQSIVKSSTKIMTVGRKEGHVQIYRLTAAVTDEHCTNPLVSPT